jgi:tyrosinase
MARFQSPLDPLFWIHHCNIDRLWEVWLSLGHSNPAESSWRDTTFEFPDPEPPGRRSLTVRDIVSTSDVGYNYDSLTLPVAEELVFGMVPAMTPSRRDDELELLGATAGEGSVRASAEIGVSAQAVARRRAATPLGMRATPLPLFLRLENVGMQTGDASSMWNVYMRVGGGERHLVGTIAPFGLAGLTANEGRQTLTFDISRLSDEVLSGGPVEVTFDALHEDVEGEPFWERASIYTTSE